jgi:hypothetical protein
MPGPERTGDDEEGVSSSKLIGDRRGSNVSVSSCRVAAADCGVADGRVPSRHWSRWPLRIWPSRADSGRAACGLHSPRASEWSDVLKPGLCGLRWHPSPSTLEVHCSRRGDGGLYGSRAGGARGESGDPARVCERDNAIGDHASGGPPLGDGPPDSSPRAVPPACQAGAKASSRALTEILALNRRETGQPVSAAFTAASNLALSAPGIRATRSR